MNFWKTLRGPGVVGILAMLLALSGAAGASGSSGSHGLEQARQAQERHTDALLTRAGVVGTALGLDDHGNAVIQVFTTRPGVGGIPNRLDGVPVQVKVTGEFVARDDNTNVYPTPVPIGVSSSNVNSINFPFCSTGTLGARLVDGVGTGFGLSNNHVYANTNGSNGAGPGSGIIQPGLADHGCTASGVNNIGTLYGYVPIKFDGSDNLVDAAIAIDGNQANPLIGRATPADGYGEPSTQALVCENDACGNLLNTAVQKRGRTTHLTKGAVTGVNAIVMVNYGKGNKARFVKQLIVQPGSFSAGGDSGSLVVTDNDAANPVGLLFAGSDSSTIISRIDLVFSELATNVVGTAAAGLRVDGKEAGPDTTPPETTITSAPPDPSNSSSATFEFTSSEPNSTFECALDGAAFEACSSPKSYSGLADGSHTFQVRATDQAGNTDPTPSSYAWSIDTTAPGQVTGLAVNTVSSSQLDLAWNSGAGAAHYNVYRSTTSGFTPGPGNLVAQPSTASHVDTGLAADTTYYYRVSAVDAAGNEGVTSDEASGTTAAAPAGVTVTGISPNEMDSGTTVSVTISGSGFAAGATVSVQNGEGPTPTASNVVVIDAGTITADVTAKSGGPPRDRKWDVVVANTNGTSGVCDDCLTVHP